MKKLSKFLFALALLISLPAVSSCGGQIDYVAQTHLSQTYEGYDFVTQGIAEVDLRRAIDGDTAHFFPKGQTRGAMEIRFMGIDTPESTGIIEAWGVAAKEFTRSKLESAKHIVLSSESEKIAPAIVDSTSTRYLGFVWVTEEESPTLNDFKLLNLWVVQECYSTAKGISDSRLADTFYACDLQAQASGRRIWGEKDPDFDPDAPYLKTTLQEINEDHETWVDARVYVEGVVSRRMKYDAYIQADFKVGDEMQSYGIAIFAMYKSYACLKYGNLIGVYGQVSEHMGNIQIVDVKYNPGFPSDYDMVVISKGHTVEPLEIDPNDITDPRYLNVLISMKNLYGVSGYGGSGEGYDNDAFSIECREIDTETGEDVKPLQEASFRVPADIAIYDRNDPTGTTVVRSYKYFTTGDVYDVVGVGAIYINEFTQNVTYQIMLINFADLVFH